MTRSVTRWLLGLFYGAVGLFHLALPLPFLSIMPVWVPLPTEVVMLTGLAELAGAVAILQPWSARLRRAGGVGLALYALCVWPANVNHMAIDMARTDGLGLPMAYHIPRLMAQPLIIWLALWAAHVIDWPLRRRG